MREHYFWTAKERDMTSIETRLAATRATIERILDSRRVVRKARRSAMDPEDLSQIGTLAAMELLSEAPEPTRISDVALCACACRAIASEVTSARPPRWRPREPNGSAQRRSEARLTLAWMERARVRSMDAAPRRGRPPRRREETRRRMLEALATDTADELETRLAEECGCSTGSIRCEISHILLQMGEVAL
jgi:hypothetical protein